MSDTKNLKTPTEGLTLLSTVEDDDAQIDIIAIHGLGHASKSWSRADTTESFWLKDILPSDLPHARVFSFGYESSRCAQSVWFDTSSHSDYISHKLAMSLDTGSPVDSIFSNKVLEKIELSRERFQEHQRPIVFVCDSLGGIILKQDLKTAWEARHMNPRHNSVLESSWGVVTFDTPRQNFPQSGYGKNALNSLQKPSYCFRVRDVDLGTFNRKSRRKRLFYEYCLPLVNLAFVMVMGNYRVPHSRTSMADPRLLHAPPNMIWPCYLTDKYSTWLSSEQHLPPACSTLVPSELLDPTPTTFVFMAILYFVSFIMYFNWHSWNRYQIRYLSVGFLLGATASLYLLTRNIPLNFITTIIPTSMTIALIVSSMLHSLLESVHPPPAEKAFRLLEAWASTISNMTVPERLTSCVNANPLLVSKIKWTEEQVAADRKAKEAAGKEASELDHLRTSGSSSGQRTASSAASSTTSWDERLDWNKQPSSKTTWSVASNKKDSASYFAGSRRS